jgi:hypothetical protein
MFAMRRPIAPKDNIAGWLGMRRVASSLLHALF